jgi:NTE family protein
MGITIVQKSNLSRPRPEARKALVLAGGAISGGAFKVGGLLALNRFLKNFSVTDFDMYVGISAGALIAAPLSAGVEPFELMQALRGSEGRLSQFSYADFYNPAWREAVGGPMRLARDVARAVPWSPLALLRGLPSRRDEIRTRATAFIKRPGLATAEALLAPFGEVLEAGPIENLGSYLPSGLFDNSRIADYIEHNLARNDIPNDFRQHKLRTGKSLYVVATNLNTAQGVVFGHDEDYSLSIAEAVQASTAIPGFFKPARLGPAGQEQDYLDGALRKTANISTAARHGAELIICYNPFRPFMNYRYRQGTHDQRSLADMGMGAVLNQAFRTMLHSRLRLGIEKLRLDEGFRGDCILIEPAETDARFFSMNPLAFWARAEAATHGYQSVKTSLEKHYEPLKEILAAYGIQADIEALEGEFAAIRQASGPTAKLDVMEESRSRRAGLRLVSGGA